MRNLTLPAKNDFDASIQKGVAVTSTKTQIGDGYFQYRPKDGSLAVASGKKEPCDLAVLLEKYGSKVSYLYLEGVLTNLSAVSNYPQIEKLRLIRFQHSDLTAFSGLKKLKDFSAGFGHLEEINLDFCRRSLELLDLGNLKRVKHLRHLTKGPMPRLWWFSLDKMRSCEPPDLRLFPKVKRLSIGPSNWPSYKWLSKAPTVEYLSIWGDKVADKDWRPLAKLPHLKTVHGMRTVFPLAARKEFSLVRPDVELI